MGNAKGKKKGNTGKGNSSKNDGLSHDPDKDNWVEIEERRRAAAKAAEQRQKQAEGRGLKNPEEYKRKVEQKEKMEKEAAKTGEGSKGLKWQV